MRLLYLSVKGLDLFADGLEVDFIARQRVTDSNDMGLTKLRGNIYKQDILAFIGINASGKTTVLRWITFILDIYLKEGKINDEAYKTLLNDSNISVEAYFSDSKYLYKIYSEIVCNEEGEYIFEEECLWKKTFIKSISRNKMLDFSDSHIEYVRSGQSSIFLSDYISIMISQIKQSKSNPQVIDLLTDTNFNIMRVLGDVPTPVIQYLDHSVEYVKSEKPSKDYISLKFKRQEKEILIHNPIELYHYLSSGTIKGLNVFAAIRKVLATGGFLIIDEIENHFNQAIVQTILNLFKHEKINVKGATLIITTHYSELLDEFERTDSIYFTFKEDTLSLKKLSELLERNDYKKSEVYQSSYVGKTAPSYSAYMGLRKYYIDFVNELNSEVNDKYD